MLHSFHVRGYRSLLDFRINLGRVTVVTGDNGVGKSNLYRALAMMQRLAEGRFAEAVALEGGMPSLLWSGKHNRNKPIRVGWKLDHEWFRYEMECGLIPTEPMQETHFKTDPDFKSESLKLSQSGEHFEAARRKGPQVELRSEGRRFETSPFPLHAPESMLSEIRDGVRHPGLAAARETLLSWRFYHQFRTDDESPLRRPRIASWSPVLAHDGANLAATLRTIFESGRDAELDAAVESAFPGTLWRSLDDSGRFQLQILRPGLARWLNSSELSDGTLRFFCLCAALLTPKPPPLIVFNEPETSLHPDLMPAVARLIASATPLTQILLVTHSTALAEAIEQEVECKRISLISHKGATRPSTHGDAERVWVFDEDE